jgi:hypothetical protein
MSKDELDFKSNGSTESKQKSKIGLYGTVGFGTVALGLSLAAWQFVIPAFRKHTLPYVPATQQQIINVFKAIENTTKKKSPHKTALRLIDLGSGDGRIVFAAAQRGYNACGVEINKILYLNSILKAFKAQSKFEYRPKFLCQNLWNVNMSNYDIIVVFGVQEMMKDLATKLDKEIHSDDVKIVSCRFPINEYKPVFMLDDGFDSVWVYDKTSFEFLNKI